MLNRVPEPEDTIICGYRRVMRLASDGSPFVTWIKVMGRRLPDYMMDSAVFVYPSKESADRGEERGATGFLIGIPSERVPGLGHIYVVTNAHVVEHGGCVVRMNKIGNRTATFNLSGAWVPHPKGDDVAIAPLVDVTDPTLMSLILHAELLLTHAEFRQGNFGIGDSVYMVGRFLGHEHRDANKPVIQQGSIAAPIRYITNPETGYEQASILVELRSMGGYSGSVVLLDPGNKILGVNYLHLPVRSPVKFFDEDNADTLTETIYFVDSPSGMAAVVPAWKIGDILNMKQFEEQRKEDDKRLEKQAGRRTKPILDDVASPAKASRRDIPIPPVSRKKFFEALDKTTARPPKR